MARASWGGGVMFWGLFGLGWGVGVLCGFGGSVVLCVNCVSAGLLVLLAGSCCWCAGWCPGSSWALVSCGSLVSCGRWCRLLPRGSLVPRGFHPSRAPLPCALCHPRKRKSSHCTNASLSDNSRIVCVLLWFRCTISCNALRSAPIILRCKRIIVSPCAWR